MKTLKIMIVAMGFFWLNSAYSFTVINFPVDEMNVERTEKPLPFVQAKKALDVVVSDNTNVDIKNLRDTIILDASMVSNAGPFPSASRDCIAQQVPYPDFARQNKLEGGVAVRFLFDESGNVKVLEACSNSPELEQYIKKEKLNLKKDEDLIKAFEFVEAKIN